jgi:hypothetical protein
LDDILQAVSKSHNLNYTKPLFELRKLGCCSIKRQLLLAKDVVEMNRLVTGLIILLLIIPSTAPTQVWEGQDCGEEVEAVLQANKGAILSVRIDSLWSHFEGRPYLGGTLTPAGEQEELIIRVDVFDCITWIDHAVALLSALSWEEYQEKLISNRYFNKEISFQTRRHFFTDWLERPEWEVPQFARQASSRKMLNRRSDGTSWIEELPFVEREIAWLPTDSLNIYRHLLQSGDLVGFYSELDGLDVSHVGMLQIKSGKPWLLHASSKSGRLERVAFIEQAGISSGVVILRKEWGSELKVKPGL